MRTCNASCDRCNKQVDSDKYGILKPLILTDMEYMNYMTESEIAKNPKNYHYHKFADELCADCRDELYNKIIDFMELGKI